MNRRTALQYISAATAGSILVPAFSLTGCQSETYQPLFFTPEAFSVLDHITELILPETPDSPGAKAVQVARFMDYYVAECYTPKHQQIIREGLNTIQESSQSTHRKSFVNLPNEEATALLNIVDVLARELELTGKAKETHYFSLIKSLTLFSYFTSEEGATQALRYVPVPGKYVGEYPFKAGDKAWAI